MSEHDHHDGTGPAPDDARVEDALRATLDADATALYADTPEDRRQAWQALDDRRRRSPWTSPGRLLAVAAFAVVLLGVLAVLRPGGQEASQVGTVGGDGSTTTTPPTTPNTTAPVNVGTVPGTTDTTAPTAEPPTTTTTSGPVATTTTASSVPGGPRGPGGPSGPGPGVPPDPALVTIGTSACFQKADHRTSPATVRPGTTHATFTATPDAGGAPETWALSIRSAVVGELNGDGIVDLALQVGCGPYGTDGGFSYLAVVDGTNPTVVASARHQSGAPIEQRTITVPQPDGTTRQVQQTTVDSLTAIAVDGRTLRTTWHQQWEYGCCGAEYRQVVSTMTWAGGGAYIRTAGSPSIGPWVGG